VQFYLYVGFPLVDKALFSGATVLSLTYHHNLCITSWNGVLTLDFEQLRLRFIAFTPLTSSYSSIFNQTT